MPAIPEPLAMTQMLAGFQLSQALYTVAELDIAAVLLDGPRTVDDLATHTGSHAPSLGRVLHALTGFGVFTHEADGTFAVTPLGATLASTTPGSVRDLALTWMRTHYPAFGELLNTVRTGTPAATEHYGRPFFDWLSQDPAEVVLFTGAMAAVTGGLRADLLNAYQLPAGGTVVDVGGADGSVLLQLIADDPARTGIVLDLPHVVPAAAGHIAARGLDVRVTAVAGDFFDAVPAADVYLLSFILHDWDDESARQILDTVAASAKPGSRLIVIELDLPEGDEPHLAKAADLTMLGMLSGKERTRSEYEALLAFSGFRVDRIVPGPPPNPFIVIEATI